MDQSDFVPGVGDLQLIGRGGTAAVFRTHDVSDGQTVAVKVLNIRLTEVGEIARFERDLAAVAALNHERSIVEVLAHGVNDSGHPWIVTPYLPDNLADTIAQRGRLPWNDVVLIGVQIADALAAAHHRGILHGDLKPGDIRFDHLGVAHLADLGLARYAGAGANAKSADARLAHCSPEVASGKRLDARTDIYSLASLLYEAISGGPPFGRLAELGAPALMDRILAATPPSLATFGVPPALERLIQSALAKDPSMRPATASGFADALTAAARSTRLSGAAGFVPPSDPTFATSPISSDDLAFDELATPPEGYPLVDEFPVLDAVEAAPLLAAAGRREKRRRRERRAASLLIILAIVAGTAAGGAIWLKRDRGGKANEPATSTSTQSTVATDDTSTPGTDSLRPVGAITYAFSASFDATKATASLTGMASPTGESRLKNALLSVGRLENELDVQDGQEPDGGAAVDDAITLLAAMRRDLIVGALQFDGQTFSVSGYYIDEAAGRDLQDVIANIRTPVTRPDLSPDPAAQHTATTPVATVTGTGSIAISAQPASFTVPGDGRLHIIPLTLKPSGGSTSLCLSSRTVAGPDESALLMNYSSCGLARIVTISSSVPGTYTVTDTFVDERGTDGPTGTITFIVIVT